jgi:hypothetical protein
VDITVSVISHGHGAEVRELLQRLAAPGGPRRVIVTFNVPEPRTRAAIEAAHWPFELRILDNASPLGFGANHNRAFQHDRQHGPSGLFAVLNPDVRWHADPFAPLQALLAGAPRAGLAYPRQHDAAGRPQDQERLVPTPARLWARHRPGERRHEVAPGEAPEWVNAAFVVLRRDAFASVGGFDEGYHMYCEDVDLCLRLQLAGWRLVRADGTAVVHDAQRASRRSPRHLLWHVASLWRLWRSRTWQAWRHRQAGQSSFLDSSHRP